MDLHIPIPNLYMSSSGPTPPDDFDLQMTLSDSPELLFVKSICIELLNLRWLIILILKKSMLKQTKNQLEILHMN